MLVQKLFRRWSHIIACFILSTIVLLIIYNSFHYQHNNDYERIRNILVLAENKSLCSERSARRGCNQKILSVSAYESNDNAHLKTNLTWSYINIFLNEAKIFYPSWIVRVYYYNLLSKTKADIENLEKLHDNLDFCSAENIPVLGNLKDKMPGKMHRFLPSIDPLVSIAMVRDLDSEIFEREVNAVNEWLSKTTYAFHIMRDNPMHNIEILGGLWGIASNRLSYIDRLKIANALLPSNNEKDLDKYLKKYSGTGDQKFLADHIWPLARQNSIAHDSFTCFWSRYIYRSDTRPFPSQRIHPSCFVGCPKPCCTHASKKNLDFSHYDRCPSRCRPKEHQNWLFC